jgi:hypothetical protein
MKKKNPAWQASTMTTLPGGMSSPGGAAAGGEDDDVMPVVVPDPPVPDINFPTSPSQQPVGQEGQALAPDKQGVGRQGARGVLTGPVGGCFVCTGWALCGEHAS